MIIASTIAPVSNAVGVWNIMRILGEAYVKAVSKSSARKAFIWSLITPWISCSCARSGRAKNRIAKTVVKKRIMGLSSVHDLELSRRRSMPAGLCQLACQTLFDQLDRFIDTVKRDEPAETRPLGRPEQNLVDRREPVAQRFEPVVLADRKDQRL